MDQSTDQRRADAVRRAIDEARRRRQERGDMSPQRGQRGDMSATPAERATQDAVRRAVEEASRAVEAAARSQSPQRGQQAQQARQQSRQRAQQGTQRGGQQQGQQARQQSRQQGQQSRQQGQQSRQQGQQARQRSQSPQRGQMSQDEMEQYGGWSKGGSKTTVLQTRLANRRADPKTQDSVKLKRVKGQLTNEISVNAHRSFRAKVDGVDLVGASATGEASARYFHGDPQAAAKKVVAILHKGLAKGLPGSKNVLGQENAVKIQLMEVTKGVSKASVTKKAKSENKDAAKFSHTYYGFREPTTPKVVTSASIIDPKTGAPLQRTFAFRNRAIPVRKDENGKELSLAQSLSRSQSIGSKIKASK